MSSGGAEWLAPGLSSLATALVSRLQPVSKARGERPGERRKHRSAVTGAVGEAMGNGGRRAASRVDGAGRMHVHAGTCVGSGGAGESDPGATVRLLLDEPANGANQCH